MEKQVKKYGSLTLYRRLFGYARPYWAHVVGYMLLNLLSTPLALLTPLPLKIAVDSVIGTQPVPSIVEFVLPADASVTAILAFAVGAVVVIALFSQLHHLVTAMLKTYVGEQLVMIFRSVLFRHAQQLSLAYHDRRGTSDSTYRIQNDALAIQTIVVESLIPFMSAAVMLVSMIYVTWLISPRLVLVALAICPILLALTVLFREGLRRRWHEARRLESSAQSVIHEVLGAVRVVKAFGRESHEHARFIKSSQTGAAARLRVAFHENCFNLLVGLTTASGAAAVLFFGVRDVLAGELSLGNLLLVLAYLGKLYDPLKVLGKQLASRQKAIAGAERALSLLDETPEVHERPDARALQRAGGTISFRNVDFSYGGGPAVLHDVSFDVPAGARVGITGKTGAGKTTLVNLIARFYDPDAGQVVLDGVDVREYRIADLRNQYAIVLQEPVLFSASIAENIAYGRIGARTGEIVAAAKAANAHEFIEVLPDGYQTQVGERGMCLSGGERQRIALARAFLKDAPILILDEPTSAVDAKTEARILEAMQRLMQGRTSFMITHRVSTLAHCDVMLQLEDGRLSQIVRGATRAAEAGSSAVELMTA